MSERPRIASALVAALTEAAPGRVIRKLDSEPQQAEAWSWEADADGWRVTSPTGEVVTLHTGAGPLADSDQVQCTCLLSPRCVHLLAVVTLLPLADEAAGADGGDLEPGRSGSDEGDPAGEPAPSATEALSERQAQAARAMLSTAAGLLERGASACGAVQQGELLRGVHTCRAEALHRLAATGVRVLTAIRALRAQAPEFDLAVYQGLLAELVETAWRLAGSGAAEAVDSALLGTARRRYEPAGSLRLVGLFCQPILAGGGHAGIVTYLADARHGIVTLSDVRPGEPARARGAYDLAVHIGDATLSHRELCRQGLIVQDATRSADGRLGSGKAVKAVRTEATSWDDVPTLWRASLEEQLDRAHGALALPTQERPAGAQLLFFEAVVVGAERDGVIVAHSPTDDTAPSLLRLVAESTHAELSTQENLLQLGRRPGLRMRVIARLVPGQPGTLSLLALGPPAQSDTESTQTLQLPTAWAGRCNVGVDLLQGGYLPAPSSSATQVSTELARPYRDPLAAMRRRLHRMALGGRATLSQPASLTIAHEAQQLGDLQMPTCATLLRRLCTTSMNVTRKLSGERHQGDSMTLTTAWLAATKATQTVDLHLQRALWSSS